MAKTKLSISLIKEGIPLGQVVKGNVSQIQLPNGQLLYYKNNQPARPKWLNSFFGAEVVNEALMTKSVSAVILYQINVGERVSRIFAVCFGFGRTLLESNVTERRFGLLVTLNSVDADKLRSIDINSMETIPLNNRIQSSALASIGNFNIDVDKDLLKSVVGKATGEYINGTLSGSDTLSISTDKRYDEMEDFLRLCFDLYKSNKYRTDGFDWVDQMQTLKDSAKIEELNNRLIEALNSENPEHIWTSIPEIVDYNSMESFRMKSDEVYDDLSLDIIKSEYPTEFTWSNIKSRKIECLNAEGTPVKVWSVYRCLYAEFTEDEHQYLLNDGKWYEVDLNYVRNVQEYYQSIPLSVLSLPDYQWGTEEEYNKKACEKYRKNYFLMDRDTIQMGGSKIEFCDIYTIDKQFIHVKKYTSSSVLSHLFFQGLVSAENLFDIEYRRKANKKMDEQFRVSEESSIHASDYEIVYAIAKKNLNEGDRPDIPFFSKVSFRSVVSRLRKYGYRVSIKGINIPDNKEGEN